MIVYLSEFPMGRLQLALNVDDIDAAVDFYRRLFGTEPAKRRPGYANFAIWDPPLKLVLIENKGAAERIRERSRGRARPRAEVVREIDERTFGHARLADAGERPPTGSSEIVTAETANWLLQSELHRLTIGE